MPDFAYSSWRSYEPNFGTMGRSGNNTDGTIPDGDNNDRFEGSDSGGTDPDTGFYNLIYRGTIDIGGTLYPVFVDDSGFPDYWLFAQNDNELPAAINLADINFGDPFAFCFAAGTMIATGTGERAVEELCIGDPVMTAEGKIVAVRWVGRQTLFPQFTGERTAPVRIRAGALGDGLPHSDLTVTADHGMILDGLVINASALVNGSTIDFIPLAELPDRVTYYHVETEAHDVILANGAPAETFIDYATRAAFDNHADYLNLYGAERIIPEMAHPRISTQRLLPEAIRARLGIGGAGADRDMRLTG